MVSTANRSRRRCSASQRSAGSTTISASCAESAQEPSVADDTDASTIPPDGEGDGGTSDAGPDDAGDGGCEGDAETCTTHELTCDEAEWCPSKTTLDTRHGLAAVWGSGKNDVWVVGAQGRVIHWNGADWTPAPTPTTQTLYAVWGSGPNDVWIASSPGVIFHGTGFSGGTATWSPLTPIADYALVSGSRGKLLRTISGTSASDVWISGESFVQKSGQPQESSWRSVIVDGGAAWKPMSNCPTTGTCPSITAMWGSGPADIWAVGPSGTALHTKGIAAGDGGVPSWTAFDSQASGELRAVWGSGPGDVWAVGAGGAIRRYTTGAERWSIVASPTKEDLNAIGAPDRTTSGPSATTECSSTTTARTGRPRRLPSRSVKSRIFAACGAADRTTSGPSAMGLFFTSRAPSRERKELHNEGRDSPTHRPRDGARSRRHRMQRRERRPRRRRT